jgi:NAD(P) transhydrogenase subunit alpha
VKIVGHLNVPGRIAASASLLYAKNLFAFLETLVDKEAKTVSINPDDELVKATMLTHGGSVVHPAFGGGEKPAAAKPASAKADAGKAPAAKKPAAKKPAAKKTKAKPAAKKITAGAAKTRAKAAGAKGGEK